jgi:UTP--glucose-1-phosphate uridylyltransferase
MIAILPAAGKGTRMSGLTAGSKELLPIGGKPVLEWVLDEALAAGADRGVVVVSPEKRDLDVFLSSRNAAVVVQPDATGLAPAVVLAASLQPAIILLPDTVFFPRSPSRRIAHALNRGYDIAIAIEKVSEEAVSRYGIVEWNAEHGRISRIIEKPRPDETPSRWAIAARFGLSARTMYFVKQRVSEMAGSSHEIDLPPILNEAIEAGHAGIAVPLEADEMRLDCGNPEAYKRACEVVGASV